jgi:hypothetical protein
MAIRGLLGEMPRDSIDVLPFRAIENVYSAFATGWPLLQLSGHIYSRYQPLLAFVPFYGLRLYRTPTGHLPHRRQQR